jgi:hypothetical protein
MNERAKLALLLSKDLSAVANQVDDALIELYRYCVEGGLADSENDPEDHARFFAACQYLTEAWAALAGKPWYYPEAEVRRANRDDAR